MKDKEENRIKLQCQIKTETYVKLKKNSKNHKVSLGKYLDNLLSENIKEIHPNENSNVSLDELNKSIDAFDTKLEDISDMMNKIITLGEAMERRGLKPWWKSFFMI